MTGPDLKALRKRLGHSLAVASGQVEVTPRTWCRWEDGTTPIPEGSLKLYLMMNAAQIKALEDSTP